MTHLSRFVPPSQKVKKKVSASMHFRKFPATLVQVHVVDPPLAKQKMPLQRKTIKINDYHLPKSWDLGSTSLMYVLLRHAIMFMFRIMLYDTGFVY